jgi:sugar phosphate isomerase/epimerase
MTDFGIATSSLDDAESVRYAVEWAVEHGFQGVEFNAPSIYLSRQPTDDLKWALEMSKEHGLRYTHHFPPSAKPGSHVAATREADLAEMREEIAAAGELGVEAIVLHPGKLEVPGVEQGEESEDLRSEAMSYFIEWVCDVAGDVERAGVVIGIENMHYIPGWVVRSHDELASAVDAVGSSAVGVTFDVGHAWGSGGVGAGIELLGDRIRHVQVHDARGPEGAGNVRDQHKEVGTGLVDWGAVGSFVGGRGASGEGFVVVVETSGFDPDREGMALRSRDVLRGMWD